jgi:hypothetical protein
MRAKRSVVAKANVGKRVTVRATNGGAKRQKAVMSVKAAIRKGAGALSSAAVCGNRWVSGKRDRDKNLTAIAVSFIGQESGLR